MADVLTKEQRHKNMQHVKSKNTSIELLLRHALWQKGYRYRKNYKLLPGCPDIVLPKYRIVIFCDSEYFHGKDWDQLQIRISKGDNSEFWLKKISRNIERDKEVNQLLQQDNWTVLRFWGNDIKRNIQSCLAQIENAIEESQITFRDNSKCKITN